MRRISILLGFAVLTVVYSSVFSHGGIDRTAAEGAEEAYGDSSARSAMPRPGEVVFEDRFDRRDGLITNEYAYWSHDRGAVTSSKWKATSGSFLARSGTGWTGVPDRVRPNAASSNGTDSAVFRLMTRRHDFENVTLGFLLRNNGFVTTPQTPPHAWDGVHLFLRYRSPSEMYYVSVERRDRHVVVKKKCPSSTSKKGEYVTLGSYRQNTFPLHSWVAIRAQITDEPSGAVAIGLAEDGHTLLAATDTGIGCDPITSGAVGLRGDDDNFQVDDFTVTATTNSTE